MEGSGFNVQHGLGGSSSVYDITGLEIIRVPVLHFRAGGEVLRGSLFGEEAANEQLRLVVAPTWLFFRLFVSNSPKQHATN